MSLGYASRLSYRQDLGGQLGAPEYRETSEQLEHKINQLTELIGQSNKTVVFTGAGISTSCGIPDFRGPNGIWTLQRNGETIPELKTSFVFAVPSLTHQALKCLVDNGIVDFVVSQNVDGLHRRSGLDPGKLAELHGNCFSERCSACKKEYIRDFEMDTVGFRATGRRCSIHECTGRLKDNILDWEDPLPEESLELSEEISSQADLAICLGTSLQITPACDIPLKTVESGASVESMFMGDKTPKDKHASLVIHDEVDKVMEGVMKQLYLKVRSCEGTPSKGTGNSPVVIEVISQHGFQCPLPIAQSIALRLETSSGCHKEAKMVEWPFVYRTRNSNPFMKFFDRDLIDLAKELNALCLELEYSFIVFRKKAYGACLQTRLLPSHAALQSKSKSRLPIIHCQEFNFETQEVDYPTTI